MKFLKKPVFIKKIRSYSDDVKVKSFYIKSLSKFLPNNNIIKSSYLEKAIDLNNTYSNISLKGGYFYIDKNFNKDAYLNFSKFSLTDINSFSELDKIQLLKNYFSLLSHNLLILSKLTIKK